MRQFRLRSEIFFKIIIFLGVKLVLTNIILSTIYQINNRPFRMSCMKYFTKSFLCYQQGNKSLIANYSCSCKEKTIVMRTTTTVIVSILATMVSNLRGSVEKILLVTLVITSSWYIDVTEPICPKLRLLTPVC